MSLADFHVLFSLVVSVAIAFIMAMNVDEDRPFIFFILILVLCPTILSILCTLQNGF